MTIKPIYGGMFDSISYLVGSEGKAAVIDAGVKAEEVITAAEELNLKIEMIILTHGHIDHITEIDALCEKTNADVYIHIDDEAALFDARVNLSAYMGHPETYKCKNHVLRDGQIIALGGLDIKVMHTPGHTPGSICLECNNVLFSGDTLFALGYGRVDFPNGSFEEIYNSITNKLFKLPEDMTVYPGHGSSTTIGKETKSNPIKAAIEW